ncbi:MAG: hypothetical protein HUU60_11325 [Armatimonadetes bacterium]|nr:hypothetical protein [Armatimonadota bacterium]
MKLQDLIDWPGLVTGGAGAVLTFIVVKVKRCWDRKERLKRLKLHARSQSTVICVWIGGTNDPLQDVLSYAQQHIPGARSVYYYRPPDDAILADPTVAEKIVDDLIEGVREIGQGPTRAVHYFFAGMVAYAPIVPALLRNVCTVVVYQKTGETYVPLHETTEARLGAARRPSSSLAKFQTFTISENAHEQRPNR